jgi:hypothetical protein
MCKLGGVIGLLDDNAGLSVICNLDINIQKVILFNMVVILISRLESWFSRDNVVFKFRHYKFIRSIKNVTWIVISVMLLLIDELTLC